jgi:hypothetical protein
MAFTAAHLGPVAYPVWGVVQVIGCYLVVLAVLVVGGIWGFRIGDGGSRGGGGSKRPRRREPPPPPPAPPPSGPGLRGDWASWEDEMQSAGQSLPGAPPDASQRQRDRARPG